MSKITTMYPVKCDLSVILWNHGNQKCAENVTGNFPGKNFEFSQKLFLTQF